MLPHRDVERPLQLLRTGGVVAAAIAAVLTRGWADGSSQPVAWVTVGLVALGTVVLWGWDRGNASPRAVEVMILAGLVLDSMLVAGVVWAFVLEPYVLAAVPAVALAGGLRYRWSGAAAGSAVAIVIALTAFTRISDLTATTFDLPGFLLIAGGSVAIGYVSGGVTGAWERRRSDFEQQAKRLMELDDLKDRYIAITSHEIRGPVSTMISAVDTVRSRWDKMDPDRRDHLLEMVYLQGRELDRLVQDLFISAEMQGGGLSLQPEWVDLEPTITRAVEAATARRRGHLLEVFVDPMRAEVDPYRITQIMRNLVENAYKYTPDRTRVVVTARGVDGGIQLEVRDDGEGIPADKRDKLFEAFTRIEQTAAGQEGVGLGLYVVSQLVAAMNGRIDLHSSSRGTTFSINIPCATESTERPRIGLVSDDDEATHG